MREPEPDRTEGRAIAPEPSPSVLEPAKRLDRIGCDHVSAGDPVAGFTRVRVSGWLRGSTVELAHGENEILVDLCAACLTLARENGSHGIHIAQDRRKAER